MKKVFNHTMHKKLWSFLVRNPRVKNKEHALRAMGWGGDMPVHGCFACESGYVNESRCECPLDWPGDESENHCLGFFSPYLDWEDATEMKWRKYYAIEIRDLPLSKHAAKYKII